MKEYSVKNTLDTLKSRLNEKDEIVVQSFNGYYYTAECTFNEPATQEEIHTFIRETGWIVPNDYKEFLLLHNGAYFFSYEYGTAFHFYSLMEILKRYDKELHGDRYPIGNCPDRGYIVISNARCQQNNDKYMMLNGIELIDFRCDFQTWLDRMIVAQGECY
ncbi:SMI1/KNR4 family protein [Bacillus cereus]|nr:SMI1/KNR4 family protein [Bacillus sp. UNC322MFChir4.1]